MGKVPQMTWSEARVGFKYDPEINEGNDLRISVGAESLGRGRIEIDSVSPTVKISRTQLVIKTFGPETIETGILVVSQPEPGTREILLRATFVPESDSKRPGRPASEPEGYVVDTWPITFRVVPKTTFGLTQAQLAAIQVLSGIIGVPALVALIIGALLKKHSSSPEAR